MPGGKDKPSLPYGWEVHQSKSYPDQIYYYNPITGASSWKCPQLISAADSSQTSSSCALNAAPRKPAALCLPPKPAALCSSTKPAALCSPPKPATLCSPPGLALFTQPSFSKSIGFFQKPLDSTPVTVAASPPFVSSSSGDSFTPRAITPENTASDKSSSPPRRKLKRPIFNVMESVGKSKTTEKNDRRYTPYSAASRQSSVSSSKAGRIDLSSFNTLNKQNCKRKGEPSNIQFNGQAKLLPSKTVIPLVKNKYLPITAAKTNSAKIVITNNNSARNANTNSSSSRVPNTNNSSGRFVNTNNSGTRFVNTNKSSSARETFVNNHHARVPVAKNNSTKVSITANNFKTPPGQGQHRNGKNPMLSPMARSKAMVPSTEKQRSPRPWIVKKSSHIVPQSLDSPDCSTDVEMFDLSQDCTDDSSDKSYQIIVDTNVLIHNLGFVNDLKDSPLEGCGPPTVVVPWVVLQELDSIKNNKDKLEGKTKLVQLAKQAVQYIYELFASKHPRVKGQNTLEIKNVEGSLDPSCNDDMILQCCLQKIRTFPREKVVLLTNDKNLCNKAMAHQINAYTVDSLYQNLKVDFTNFPSPSASRYTLSCSVPGTNRSDEKDDSLRAEVDRIMVSAKGCLKTILGDFLEREMRASYEELWLTVVHLKPPWSLLEIFDCLIKHWIAVFTFTNIQKKKHELEHLRHLLGTRAGKGYIVNEKEGLDFVSTSLSLCFGLVANATSEIKDAHALLMLLEKQLKRLGQNNPASPARKNSLTGSQNPVATTAVSTKNTAFCTSPSPESTSEADGRVRAVFQHVWETLNHLCGTVLDSLEWPHTLEYQRPTRLPLREETDLFIPVLYPQLQKLRQIMLCVVENENITEEKLDENLSALHKQLHITLPQLKIQSPLPTTMSIEELAAYCKHPNNKAILQGGLKQLLHYFSLIHKSIIGANKR